MSTQFAHDKSRRAYSNYWNGTRLFGEDDASSEGGHERLRNRAPDSSVFDAEPAASPPISDHPFLSRLTGSPNDHRKRRPDLFGSPPILEGNSPKRRFTERLQRAGSQVYDEDDGEPTAFNNYMAGRKPPTAAELFEEVTDNEQEATPQDENRAPQARSPAARFESVSDNDSEMEITQQAQPPPRSVLQERYSSKRRSPFADLGSDTKSTPKHISSAETETRRESLLERFRANIAQNVYSPGRVPSTHVASDADSDMEVTQQYIIERLSRQTTPRRISHSPRVLYDKSPLGQRIASIAETLENLGRSPRYARSSDASELGSMSDHLLLHEDGAEDILDEELSHLYDSSNELEDPPSPSLPTEQSVPLSEFLVLAKISFGESVLISQRPRTSGFDTSEGPVRISDQANAAATTIPELEMYRSYCEEVKDLITEDEKAIERFNEQLSTVNPPLVIKYLEGDLDTQSQIDEKLKDLVEHSGFKALQTLLEYKQTKTDALLKDLQQNADRVSEDERCLEDFKQSLTTRLVSTEKHFKELEEKLTEARQKKQKYDEINHDELENKLSDIKDQRTMLSSYRSDIAKLVETENALTEKSVHLGTRREELEVEIAKIEKELGSKNRLTERDLQRAKDHYEDCKKFSRLEPLEKTDELLEVMIMNDISVRIENPKAIPRGVVSVRMMEARSNYYHNLLGLVEGLNGMVQNIQDANQVVETVAINWTQARLIYRELYNAGGRYFIQYEQLESDDFNERGVRSTMVVSSYLHRAKVTIIIELKVKDLLRFPAINMEAVRVELNQSRTSVT
ncbi:Spc7 kinetochore protein-domain-containing protein [Fennellomyces sp. T-0311]|nr:Spc7 kinetochore protein-domain-containing protein [Fennellomyces sp. T-0311]